MRLSKTVFLAQWEGLCDRFNRKIQDTTSDARRYYDFLAAQMTAEEFVQACRDVWLRAKFFPRPADFLQSRAEREWDAVLDMTTVRFDKQTWDGLSETARVATRKLGGLEGIGQASDLIRARAAWLEAYERAIHLNPGVSDDTEASDPDALEGPRVHNALGGAGSLRLPAAGR